MTMEGLEGFFEHVGILNPQCIAEELPAPPQTKSPSLVFEKRISSEQHTPNYTPPPPPPPPPPPLTDRISESSAKALSTAHKNTVNSTSQANATSTGLLADVNSDGAPYSKIRKTNNETRTEEHRERIIPIKLLHTPSKTTLQMEHNQVSGSRHSFVESTTQQSTKYDTVQGETLSGSVIKRYAYDPSSMSHKEFILKAPSKKEIITGNGIDLVKDTHFSNKGSSALLQRANNETLINDVPMENLVSSGNYKHIKSSPPPDYSPKAATQRTPLATLAGADQLPSGNIQQPTFTSINIDDDASTRHVSSRFSSHRQAEKRSSARDMKGNKPLTELPSALSVGSDWTYHTGDEFNATYFDHSIQRKNQSVGQMSSTKQQNDFIITPEMKRSRSPIIVRVTMSQKDKSVRRIDDEQEGGTAVDSKKPFETNVDDIAPPDYDSAWANFNRTSQLSLDEKQNVVSACRADDTVTAYASTYGYSGDATAVATKSPLSIGGLQQGSPQETQIGRNIQNLTDIIEKRNIYGYGEEENKTAIATTTTATGAITGGTIKSDLQQNSTVNDMNGRSEAANRYSANYRYSSDEITTAIANAAITTAGCTATTVYQEKANFNGGQIATTPQLATSYGHEGEKTTTKTKAVLTTGGGSIQQPYRYGIHAKSAMKKSAKGFGYVEDETTTTTKTVVTVENDGMNAQQKRGASASLARKSATEYNYDESDDELTTTTKTVTTTESSGGAPRVPLHQTQSYGLKKNAENYSFEDERTTATKVRYDMPPGSIDPLLGERQKGENYLQSSQVYGRNEAENLLGRHSSLHVHQSAGSTKNYLDRDSQLSSSLMRSTLNPRSKKRRFSVCDLVFFVLAPCFILLILVAVLITLGVA